jgi:hypothetical protein
MRNLIVFMSAIFAFPYLEFCLTSIQNSNIGCSERFEDECEPYSGRCVTYKITTCDNDKKSFLFVPVLVCVGCISYLIYHVNARLDEYFKKNLPYLQAWHDRLQVRLSAEDLRNVSVQWEYVSSVYWSKLALLTQILCMLAYTPYIKLINPTSLTRLEFVKMSPYVYFILNTILIGVSYYCMSTWRWIKVERRFVEGFQRIRVSFFCSSFPVSRTRRSREDEICTICQGANPTSHFCQYHCFHEDCLIGHLYAKTEQILDECQITKTLVQMYEEGVRREEQDYFKYTIELSRRHLPSCPNCNRYLRQNNIDIKVAETYNGRNYSEVDATVRIRE